VGKIESVSWVRAISREGSRRARCFFLLERDVKETRTQEESAFRDHARSRSPETLRHLLTAFRPSIFCLCHQVLEHRQDAEDVSQRVLLEVAAHAGDFPSLAAFRSWIFRVCLSKSLNSRRSRARRAGYEARRPGNGNGHPSEGDDRESRRALLEAIEKLPDEDRAIILERYFDGEPLQVLADRRGCSKVAIWSRLKRIRDRLRKRLVIAGLGAAVPDVDFWLGALRFNVDPGRGVGPGVGPRAGPAASSTGVTAKLGIAASIAGALLVGLASWSHSPPREFHQPRSSSGTVSVTRPVDAAPVAVAKVVEVDPSHEARTAGPKSDDDKEHVRWLYQKTLIQIRTGTRVIWESSTALERFVERVKAAHRDPAGHGRAMARFAGLLYRVAAEESGIPVPEEKLRRVKRLEEEFENALRRLPADPGVARLQAEVEADLAFARGMVEILPREGAGSMMYVVIDRILKRGSAKSMPREHLLREIVSDWSAALPPDAAPRSRLEEVANGLASELDRITRDFGMREDPETYDDCQFVWNFIQRSPVQPYDPIRRMEHQVECLKATRQALESVRNEIAPDTWCRFKEAEPWTYAVSRPGMDGVVDRRE
jgi:RNA polymerase sigma-70 factor (ECF subfamily)